MLDFVHSVLNATRLSIVTDSGAESEVVKRVHSLDNTVKRK